MFRTLILISATIFFLTSCEDKNDDKIYNAQRCLDTATPATVDTCVDKVAGISSTQAYVIRCSADFLRANITESTIVSALEQLDSNNDPTKNATVTLFKFFTFTSTNAADLAVSNCLATGSSTLHDLALSAQAATLVNLLSGGADLETWVTGLTPGAIAALDADQLIALGETVLTLQPSVCGPNGQFEGTKVCTDLNNAIGDQDPTAVAKELLAQLQNAG
jgi:hypothetical protein